MAIVKLLHFFCKWKRVRILNFKNNKDTHWHNLTLYEKIGRFNWGHWKKLVKEIRWYRIRFFIADLDSPVTVTLTDLRLKYFRPQMVSRQKSKWVKTLEKWGMWLNTDQINKIKKTPHFVSGKWTHKKCTSMGKKY